MHILTQAKSLYRHKKWFRYLYHIIETLLVIALSALFQALFDIYAPSLGWLSEFVLVLVTYFMAYRLLTINSTIVITRVPKYENRNGT